MPPVTPSERTAHPLGLVAKGQTWYWIAATEAGEVRSYRVSRIRTAELLEEPSARPEGFDLAAYWEQSKRELKRKLPHYEVKLLADPAVAPRFRRAPYVQILPAAPEEAEPSAVSHPLGWVLLHADLGTFEYARDLLPGFGAALFVLEPAELRTALAEQAHALLKLYENPPHAIPPAAE